ncbi:MAG: molybdopterin molybdotransferase MoeA [Armatimonadota bacterium]|nr:molybdopterin molybdotransferase MoeA [Armatimonadota bacterium]
MLTYDQALVQILSQIAPLAPAELTLTDALGCVLAEDIVSPQNIPPFDNSSMDGFAVRAADLTAVPKTLPVQGDIPAGALSVPELLPGRTLRIMTGAPVPAGADAVVPVEDTEARPDGVAFLEPVAAGENIRRAGEDVMAGSVVVTAGSRIRPAEIGMMAVVGRAHVRAHPRPRVAILSTGDELIEPGKALQNGQIYNSNAYALAAQVADAGGIVTHRLHARDTAEALREAFDACAGVDVLITSGGVSVGDYDFVKNVFAERGTMDFWRVAIRPGKPIAFGRWGQTVFFGLPGNPVSSMVTFELFVRPALRKMHGLTDLSRPAVTARLTEEATHTLGRQSYQRAVVTLERGKHVVRLTRGQGSGMMHSLVQANALLVVPADASTLPAGEAVTVLLLD